jgi:hypothetical protein
LLRFVAELIAFLGGDEHGHYAMAIPNAADIFERSASARARSTIPRLQKAPAGEDRQALTEVA